MVPPDRSCGSPEKGTPSCRIRPVLERGHCRHIDGTGQPDPPARNATVTSSESVIIRVCAGRRLRVSTAYKMPHHGAADPILQELGRAEHRLLVDRGGSANHRCRATTHPLRDGVAASPGPTLV